jgi:tRNA dimethylallyltransferase
MKQQVVLIAGPTASGKSEAAIRVAEDLGGIIVNADAMQVYRDLRVITARPDLQDEQRVVHHLFGHVDAAERCSVGRWLADVAPVFQAAARRSQPVVFVGGTGLYFKALCEGLSDMPEVPHAITGRWQRALKQDGPWALYAVLMARDPEAADMLEPSDGQRIVRALSVKEATGRSIRHFQATAARPLVGADSRVLRVALLPEREVLYQRIDARFDAMVAGGAVDEVEALLARKLDPDLPAMKAIGVPEIAMALCSEISLQEAIEKAKTNSRRYAKRQMTWIRGQMADWPTLPTLPGSAALSKVNNS